MKHVFFKMLENSMAAVAFAERNEQDYALLLMGRKSGRNINKNRKSKQNLRREQRPRLSV